MDQLVQGLGRLVDVFGARAAALDAEAAFPAANLADLRRLGALAAPLPRASGGLGAGSEPGGAALIAGMLRLIGRGHLATGRLFEGHVNAIKLVAAYGAPAALARMEADVKAGHLFGLWVTDREPGLRLADGFLHGGKVFCSGAGHVRRALVTAQPDAGLPVMALVAPDDGERARPGAMRLQGMRSAVTGAVDLTGLPAEAGHAASCPAQPGPVRVPAGPSGGDAGARPGHLPASAGAGRDADGSGSLVHAALDAPMSGWWGRSVFDRIYARGDDPWDFGGSPYEAAKYDETLAALPRSRFIRGLEIGCSIGVQTRRLDTPTTGQDAAEGFVADCRPRLEVRLHRQHDSYRLDLLTAGQP